jgi:outer membrane biogenesis lipoprotein LolB
MTPAQKLRHAVWATLFGFIAGCSHVPEQHEANGLQKPSAGMAPWMASGKIALTTADTSDTASFLWDRRSRHQESVRFSGPLGLGAIEIRREGNSVYWQDGDVQRPLTELGLTPGATAMLAELPMAHLGDWLVGAVPAKSESWQQEVRRWQAFPPWQVPKLMLLNSDHLSLRIAVNDWRPE